MPLGVLRREVVKVTTFTDCLLTVRMRREYSQWNLGRTRAVRLDFCSPVFPLRCDDAGWSPWSPVGPELRDLQREPALQ